MPSNQQLVKYATDNSLTLEGLAKLAYLEGFEKGVRESRGDVYAEDFIKTATQYNQDTGRDLVSDLTEELL